MLLRRVEETAQKNGYAEVKIRAPETLYWYKQPATVEKDREKEIRGVQWRMRRFYAKIAHANGYTRMGNYYVKGL